MKAKYQVCTFDKNTAAITSNMIDGRPNLWDVESEHDTLEDAQKAYKIITGRACIRLSDDINPDNVISDKYRIRPEREPELNTRLLSAWKRK